MALSVEQDEAFCPVNISVFCVDRIVFFPHDFADVVKKLTHIAPFKSIGNSEDRGLMNRQNRDIQTAIRKTFSSADIKSKFLLDIPV